MSAADFTVAMARMFAVYDCYGAALDEVRTAMDAEKSPDAKAVVWDVAKPILSALEQQRSDAIAAFNSAKKEAGL